MAMKQHKDSPFMSVHVDLDRNRVCEFACELGYVKMLPFKGTASGEWFNGIVEPCGVDTQITNQNDVRHMSARYMLTGHDAAGNACHIYVENNAWFTDGAKPQPFRGQPTLMTDSPWLAPKLHRNHFVAEGKRDETGLWIRFYELESLS